MPLARLLQVPVLVLRLAAPAARLGTSAPAFSTAACVGLSSASNAALLTITAFFGSQAWVS